MKKLLLLILALSVSAGVIVACTKNNNKENTSDEKKEDSKTEEKTTDIKGYVGITTESDAGIVNFTVYTNGNDVYLMNTKESFSGEVSLGDKVTVTVEGDISDTRPMQATVKDVKTEEEFKAEEKSAEIYEVPKVHSAKIAESLSKSDWIFERFTSYGDCISFIEGNELTDSFSTETAGFDISAISDEFFTEKQLCIFITERGNSDGSPVGTVYAENGNIWLKLTENSNKTSISDSYYNAFIISLSSDIPANDGKILIKRVLYSEKSEYEYGEEEEKQTEEENKEDSVPENE